MSAPESQGLEFKGLEDDNAHGRVEVHVAELRTLESDDSTGSVPSDLLDFVNKDAKSPLLPYTKVTNGPPTTQNDLTRDRRADHYNYGDDEQAPDYFIVPHHNANGIGQPIFCNVCNKTHFPISGPTRDGIWCLPDWFPKSRHVDPWDAFREVMAYLVQMEESTQKGYQQRKVDSQEWSLHFHEKGKHWTTEHAQDFGGWWKCRDDKDAPEAERRCIHCHRFKREEAAPSHYSKQNPPPFKDQKQLLETYVEHHTKMQGERDKQAALAMLRRDGVPEIYSKPVTYQEQKSLMQPRSKLETSATGRQMGDKLLAVDPKLLDDPQSEKSDAGEAAYKFPLNPANYP
jgi:hypothetical protein